MRLNIHEIKQAAQLVLDWHSYLILELSPRQLGGRLCCLSDIPPVRRGRAEQTTREILYTNFQ